jgi:hypothetical protein
MAYHLIYPSVSQVGSFLQISMLTFPHTFHVSSHSVSLYLVTLVARDKECKALSSPESCVSVLSLALHSLKKKTASCLCCARWKRKLHSDRGRDNELTYRRVAHFRGDDRWAWNIDDMFISRERRSVGRRTFHKAPLCAWGLNPVLCLTPANCGTAFALLPYCQNGTSELIGVPCVPKNYRHGIVRCPFWMHVPG